MANNLTIRLATPADVPSLAPIVLSAFADSDLEMRCFPPSAPETSAFWDARLRNNIADPTTHVVLVEYTPRSPAEAAIIVGWASWRRRPATETPPQRTVYTADMYPAAGDGALAARFFQLCHDGMRRVRGNVNHWYLSTLVVRKDWQRKGVGSMLVRWGTAKADEDQWEAYMNGTEDGRGLYERYGFQVADQSLFAEMGITSYHMRRDISMRAS